VAHASRRTRSETTRVPWGYAAGGGLVIAAAIVAVIALWMSSPPGSRAISLGSAAPLITLPATTGSELGLAQLRGSKVVLYFYEGAG